MIKVSDSATKMLHYIAEHKTVTSTELRRAKLTTQHEFLHSRKELLVEKLIKRKQDHHPRAKRGRRADLWVVTKLGLDLVGMETPADYIEESSYNIPIKRQISFNEKSSIDTDLGSGFCVLLPELSNEPQELMDIKSVSKTQMLLVEKQLSTYQQIEKKWPEAKTWNGDLTEAVSALAPGSLSYMHADLMSIFGEETIQLIKSTKNKLTSKGCWFRLTNTAMSFRDNWSSRQSLWNMVPENLLDLHDVGYLDYDHLRHYLLYCNNNMLHSAWMSWSCLVKTHIESNMAVIPRGIVHYRGNSTSTPMESYWFSILPNNDPKSWIKYSLSEMVLLLNNANSNFYDNQSINNNK
jgi:hypothetical protein